MRENSKTSRHNPYKQQYKMPAIIEKGQSVYYLNKLKIKNHL